MRKRSAYKPRAALVNPLTLLEPLNKDQQQALLLRCYSALNSMTQGAKAEPNDWRDIADVLNIVETMALGAVRFVLEIYAEAMNVITAADMLSIIRTTHKLVAQAQASGSAQVVSL